METNEIPTDREVYNTLISQIITKKACPPITCGIERAQYIIKSLSTELRIQYMHHSKNQKKNQDKSLNFRNKGNECMESKENSKKKSTNFDDAIEFYTKAVAYAPNESQELALAYYERSIALFEARLIHDCLLDIERVLNLNFPNNLKTKLYIRKGICYHIVEQFDSSVIKDVFAEAKKWIDHVNPEERTSVEMELLELEEKLVSIDRSIFTKWNPHSFLPKLNEENPSTPGISNALKIIYINKNERCFLARRDIKPGETLIVQKAYAKVVWSNMRYRICWHCGGQTWSGIPCEECVEVVFCSEKCRDDGIEEHHKFECPIIQYFIGMDIDDKIYLSLRIFTKAYKEYGSTIKKLENGVKKIEAKRGTHSVGENSPSYDSNKFANIYCLRAPINNREYIEPWITGDAIMIAFLLATKTLFFGEKLSENLRSLSKRKDFVFVVVLLERIRVITTSNTFGACSFGPKPKEGPFSMLVPTFDLIGHSCNPTTYRTNHADYIVITACYPIKKNHEVLADYGLNFFLMPKEDRQQFLVQKFSFLCRCEACKNDWPHRVFFNDKNKNDKSKTAKKLSNKVMSLNAKYKNLRYLGDTFGRQHSFVYDTSKNIVEISKAILECIDCFGNDSGELLCCQRNMVDLLGLNGSRLMTLD